MQATANKKGIKERVQKLGSNLSSMVMPNIGAFIAWGVLTALFIPDGYLPNKHLAEMVTPMITYLLPLLIGYTGGKMVHGQRGAVVGAIATMGVIVGTDIPMFIGAMIMGPLGGWCIKKFDQAFQHRIRVGFEMLVNNFSSGLIGFALAILAFKGVGPVVEVLTHLMAKGVEIIVHAHLLPLANVLIEPAKILFLNNAINHGILTPLGTDQAAEAGKSILFLLEANPGPGLGLLLAYSVFGRGSARSSAPGAAIIQFFGGIHEIYFPYVMMKPLLFLAVMAGGVSGTFTFSLLGAGLKAASSPGSIIAILLMTPKGWMNYVAVLAGVIVAAVVSFAVAAIILKMDKSTEGDLSAAQASVQAAKATAKGQTADSVTAAPSATASYEGINKIIFACDAGMGSSAMGASILRDKVKKAGLDLPVTNSAINQLHDDNQALIVTQEELAERAHTKAPNATFVAVENFMNSPRYDEIVHNLSHPTVAPAAANEVPEVPEKTNDNLATAAVSKIVFVSDTGQGSVSMGTAILTSVLKRQQVKIPVSAAKTNEISDDSKILYITTAPFAEAVKAQAPQAQHLVVNNVVEEPTWATIAALLEN